MCVHSRRYVCERVYVCLCMCMGVCVKGTEQLWCHSLGVLKLVFETGSLLSLELAKLARVTLQWTQKSKSARLTPVLRFQFCATVSGFFSSVLGSNSGPHDCTAGNFASWIISTAPFSWVLFSCLASTLFVSKPNSTSHHPHVFPA